MKPAALAATFYGTFRQPCYSYWFHSCLQCRCDSRTVLWV